MNQASIGRLMLAVDLADKPGEITIAGLVIIASHGEIGIRASAFGMHVWVLLIPSSRERSADS